MKLHSKIREFRSQAILCTDFGTRALWTACAVSGAGIDSGLPHMIRQSLGTLILVGEAAEVVCEIAKGTLTDPARADLHEAEVKDCMN